MTDLFISVLNLTLAGSAAAVIVLVLRLLLRRVPGIYSYFLWIFVFFRFLSPFSVETAISLFPVSRQAVEPSPAYELIPSVHTGISAVDETANAALVSAAGANPAGSVSPVQVMFAAAALIWAAGVLLIGAVQLWRLIRFLRNVRTGVRMEGEEKVRLSEWAQVPAVVGILRPEVVLPYGIPEKDRGYILAHERTHIARKDHLVKAICFAAAVIHWFNPLAWISYERMCLDMEVSCDEKTVANMDLEKRKEYGTALLQFAGRRSGLWISPAFGESHTRERVRRVLKFRRPKAWAAAAAGICTVLAGCGLLTSPEPDMASAVSIIGGADGPTSVFVAGKMMEDEGEISISYEPASWAGTEAAEGIVLDAADPALPEEGSVAVLHGPRGVFVFCGTGEELLQAASVDMAGVDEQYRAMYEGGQEYGGPVFAARGGGGNAVVMGFMENGKWLEDHMYLLLLETGELIRTQNGARLAEIFDSMTAAAGEEESEREERLVSETRLLQDLMLEITENGETAKYPLFPGSSGETGRLSE